MVQHGATETGSGVQTEDIRRICGDIADWKLVAIVALSPGTNDLELAVAWADNEDEFRQQRPLSGITAQIYDILTSDEEPDEER